MSETKPDIQRELFRARVLLGGITGISVVAIGLLAPVPIAAGVAGTWAVLQVYLLWRLRRFVASLASEGGDLMFRSGDLGDATRFRALMRAELLEGPFTYVAVPLAALHVSSIPDLLWVLLTFVPATMVWAGNRQRRSSLWLQRGILALHSGDLDTAERAVLRLRSATGAMWQGGRSVEAELAARRGELDRAREILEASWAGTLDVSALSLAILRMEHGDAALVEAVLAAPEPSDALGRYTRVRLRAHRDLLAGRYDAVLEGTRDLSAWPPNLSESVAVLDLAARRARGDGVEVPREMVKRFAWWREWYPGAFALLAGTRAPVIEPLRPLARSVVLQSAPIDPHIGGFVPFEWLPSVRRRRRPTVQLVVLSLLFGLGLLLALLLMLLRAFGGPVPPILALAAGVAVLAMGVSSGGIFRILLQKRAEGGDRAAVKADGTRVGLEHLGLWGFGEVFPGLLSGLVIGVVPPALELVMRGTVWGLLLTGPMWLLFLWLAGRYLVGVVAVVLAHEADAERWLRFAEASPGWLLLGDGRGAVVGLARLWHGDADGARGVWEQDRLHSSRNADFVAWLDAGSGDIELDGLLARDLPEAPGPAYRLGVTLALGAIAKGRCGELDADRRAELRAAAQALPNRFGDLLGALVDRIESSDTPLPADLLWFDAVWPGLWRSDG